MKNALHRRSFLQAALLAGGAVALHRALGPIKAAHADDPAPRLMLLVYFSGGWDQLLALDPRPNDDPRFSESQAYAPGGSGIHPAYDQVLDPGVKAVLGTTPSGIQTAGGLTFGPAVPASLLAHASDLSIARGVAMDTLAHEVGRRYLLTGKFPRGLAANGSAITTVVAAGNQPSALPNLAISTESYSESQPTFAAPVMVTNASDVLRVLDPLGTPLSPASLAALGELEKERSCEARAYDGAGLVKTYEENRLRARSLAASSVSKLFQFNATKPGPDLQPLFDALDIQTAADLAGDKGRAALAAQALHQGVARAVSVRLADGLDTHDDWDVEHAPALRTSLDVLGRLIGYLKSVQLAGTTSSVWSRTTMLVFSEFARTPLLNVRGGRDHHLASSCLLAGPGLKRGVVIGGTTDVQMAARNIDPKTGAPVPSGGMRLRPADIHATVLSSMGMPITQLSNQSPNVIPALLA
ncbi:MAG: DUF1501 domain-containing protein [Deltaproteobacteria bacterium]|nr:DUF1501 domain-containing protein [Deltaproteobacteria bacterium]